MKVYAAKLYKVKRVIYSTKEEAEYLVVSHSESAAVSTVNNFDSLVEAGTTDVVKIIGTVFVDGR